MSPLVAVILASAALLAIFLVFLTALFFQGKCLFLLFGARTEERLSGEKAEKTLKTGKRMSFVTASLALLLITIILYQAGLKTGNDTLTWIGTVSNNVAFILLVVALVAFFVLERAAGTDTDTMHAIKQAAKGNKDTSAVARRSQRARIEAFTTPTLLFLIGIVVIALAVGVVFAYI